MRTPRISGPDLALGPRTRGRGGFGVGAPSGAPFFRPPRVFSPRSLCPKGFPGLGRPPEGGRLCVWPDRPVGGTPSAERLSTASLRAILGPAIRHSSKDHRPPAPTLPDPLPGPDRPPRRRSIGRRPSMFYRPPSNGPPTAMSFRFPMTRPVRPRGQERETRTGILCGAMRRRARRLTKTRRTQSPPTRQG
jgi:hypothetical protein